jgi:hypothetical protein
MGNRSLEPGPLFSASRRRGGPFARRDRDWQFVILVVSLVAMFLFEMFHSPPCRLGWTSCTTGEFVAQIIVNAIWATVMGAATGVALAAIMLMVVESLDTRRSHGNSGPLVRTVLGVGAIVIVLVIVLVRYEFVAS